ncbi:MAG: pilus assembly protein PilM [Candidatus Aminicenantes bacterium]|nr:pilus assembly protein PilM [Candidatus Aminicenantes bacterium]
MFGLKKSKGVVGLDIGSHAIKAVELIPKRKAGTEAYELAKIAYEVLPHDSIVEGTIIDSTAVVETIRLIFEENKIKNRNVAISISGNSVIIKKISLPHMEREELAESIIWEAKHNIPYPYEETNVDYAILKPPKGTETKSLDILLVAAKKDKIANYSNVVHQAKKNLVAIEVDVFALQNALEINYPETFENKTVAMVNIGANITNILILERGLPQLFRDLSLGGSFFTENMRKELTISLDEAERLLKGLPVKNVDEAHVEEILSQNIRDLVDEIDKTFTFYEAGDKKERKIEQIFLSGGLANLKALPVAFEERFAVPTEIFNPFRNIHYKEKDFDSVLIKETPSIFGVAVGLALRRMD